MAEGQTGLAMCSSAAKPQTEAAKPPKGRADLRAAKRSAARPQAEAEAPKQLIKKKSPNCSIAVRASL
ncbi:hypothetical protein SGRA_2535 [Saprospira grandis str. Lewin]|uniref:Uncharacterized protein n=1 Tax=Saprospira grandis (strain Lewin) TaxID=984262 RepID=H6L6L7_SAPGL|nr:hypothetical protein SGRA_2535 [Saprospira grandis str. Lewin]